MAACARAVQQADGSLALVLDPAATDLATCSYVVQSGPEVANNPFALSAQEGGAVSAAIIACWLAAYYAKALISVFKGSDEK